MAFGGLTQTRCYHMHRLHSTQQLQRPFSVISMAFLSSVAGISARSILTSIRIVLDLSSSPVVLKGGPLQRQAFAASEHNEQQGESSERAAKQALERHYSSRAGHVVVRRAVRGGCALTTTAPSALSFRLLCPASCFPPPAAGTCSGPPFSLQARKMATMRLRPHCSGLERASSLLLCRSLPSPISHQQAIRPVAQTSGFCFCTC
jgi:hypothetical protein